MRACFLSVFSFFLPDVLGSHMSFVLVRKRPGNVIFIHMVVSRTLLCMEFFDLSSLEYLRSLNRSLIHFFG